MQLSTVISGKPIDELSDLFPINSFLEETLCADLHPCSFVRCVFLEGYKYQV